ncbi:MAG: DUF3883 domain-containing protein [Chthoniobacterales bacterium]
MNGSSVDIIGGVSPGQIRVLLELLGENAWRSRAFVENRYRERAHNFDQTLTFLHRIGWVRTDSDQIHAVNGWMERIGEQNAGDPSVELMDALLDSPGEHQSLFGNYLGHFQSVNGIVSCPARGESGLADTSARDFLMQLGAVSHEPRSNRYFLQPPFFGAYVWAMAQKGPNTHAVLIDGLEKRHQLGRNAELAVVRFERERLGLPWSDRVQHVASGHPCAPFDIKSVTVIDGRPRPRYVEVKAVSPLDHAFNWSANEVEAARLLSSDFYLYLVPTRGTDSFDLASLRIIADPFSEVYSQPSAWDKLPTNFLCSPLKALIS